MKWYYKYLIILLLLLLPYCSKKLETRDVIVKVYDIKYGDTISIGTKIYKKVK